MEIQSIKRNGYTFNWVNRSAFEETYREVFENEEYGFDCSNPEPYIIDCGSNIGISVLYFKHRYPNAHVVAFEPDPVSFRLLTRNVEENRLRGVELVNAAVSDKQGEAIFYGEFSGSEPDSRGNSLVQSWAQRKREAGITVQTVRLSAYLKRPVDYLKMDIEGAEVRVIDDIQPHLSCVERLYVEFHQTVDTQAEDWNAVYHVLKRAGFSVDVAQKAIDAFLPDRVQQWAAKMKPALKIVRAQRPDLNRGNLPGETP